MTVLLGAPPEDLKPLHPSVDDWQIVHFEKHGLIVARPEAMELVLTDEIERGRYGKTSAYIARRAVNRMRRV